MTNRRLNFTLRFVVVALLLTVAVVLVNAVLGSMAPLRLDLTEDGLYTVSPAAKRILTGLQVPVQVKYYITESSGLPPELQNLERDVSDKLSEFAVISGGKLSFSVVDPSKDDELAEKIAAKNIRPFQVQTIDRDAMGIKLVYSAIEISYLDKDPELLPQILPQSLATLEYDLCTAVTRLTRDIDPVVAIFASRPRMDPQMVQLYMQMGQAPPEPPEVYSLIGQVLQSQAYDVRPVQITADSPIPEEATTLVVLAPKTLEQRQLYEINRFVQRGGRLVLATQDYEFNYGPSQQGGFSYTPTPQQSNVAALLDAWGIAVSDAILMDTNTEVLAIPSERNVGGLRLQVQEPVQNPVQIKVTPDQLNDDTSITNGLGSMLYLWGSRLELDEALLEGAGITPEVLFTSSNGAWEADYVPGPLAPMSLLQNPDRMLGAVPLAVLLKGELPNGWADGEIPFWNSTVDSLRVATPVEEFVPVQSAVVVVGCSKMFEDSFLQMVPGNAMLLLNAVDALTLGDDLIEIRAKVTTVRSLRPLGEGARLLIKLVVIGLVPMAVGLFGIYRHLRRRRQEARFLAAQGALQGGR
ncbi:hypothetical protein DRQ53_06745 [bacterium]|nr:MAG: hypothetical protein DRQ53_06745 [bacterium]